MAPRTRSMKRRKFESESVQKALVDMIIIDELPFSVVEEDEFTKRMETVFPGFHMPSSEAIARVCDKYFMDEKLKLKSLIKSTDQKVCLSLDTWRSNQSMDNYLCVTAHFIDNNWNLQKKIIGFSPICKDNGEEIGKTVEKCLHDWGINNVLAISAGNASSYDAAVTYLGTRLANTVLDGKFLRLKCFTEFTNTMVNELLKDFDKWIKRVRVAVRYMLQSPTRIEMFENFARQYHISLSSESCLSLDCPSRWTSTVEMLHTSQKFEDVFNWFEEIPVYIKWEKVRKAVFSLEGFYKSAEKILDSDVTSNMFLVQIANTDFELDDWGISCVRNEKLFFRAVEMKWKYNEYWEDVEDSNMLIYVANILDPRYKMGFTEFYFGNKMIYRHKYTDEGEPLWKKKAEWVAAAMYDLFNEYVGLTRARHQTANFRTSGLGQKTELDIYLNEEIIENFDGFEILVWWKVNNERFPILSKMAKDVLAIPISAVGGNVLGDFRSSLSPLVVEALVCIQDWINKSKMQIKVQEGSTDLDKVVKGIYEQLEGVTNDCGSNSL